MDGLREFYGPNAGYALELLERYQRDPQSVDEQTRRYFDQLSPEQRDELIRSAGPAPLVEAAAIAPVGGAEKVKGVVQLAQAIRWYGHLAARLDPLGSPPPDDPVLRLETYDLSEDDLSRMPAQLVGGIAGQGGGTALDAIRKLREIYSTTIGFDYLQNRDPEERQWLREAAESCRYTPELDPIDPRALLEELTRVETFEHFLQRTFVGKTRFSIEGLDMLVPMLNEVIRCAVTSGIHNTLIGMAHRGRLNVLAHVLGKPIAQILAEFKDPLHRRVLQNEPLGFTGDVKYHAGASMVIDEDNDPQTLNMTVTMAPNPSHLEAVNPVIEGMARAAGTDSSRPGQPIFDPAITLPILIHGDVAFLGQGVVAETLNLYRLPGYTTGGTIHIIANNQIGFTTNPSDSRSTLFASDLAKGFRIPIIHVNADDPEACLTAVRTAFGYRERFQRDFLIDLIGYRRRGHNEGDDPAFTQPLLYQTIEAHPSVRKIWAGRLVEQGLAPTEQPEQMYQEQMDALQGQLDQLDPETLIEPLPTPPPPGAARDVDTRVAREHLEDLNRELLRAPDGFSVHPRLARVRQRRDWPAGEAAGPDGPGVDWSTAEELALATILENGIPIRLTGQDVERGTFSHRHAVLFDVNTGQRHLPLQALPQARAGFEIYNSPLSEYAALGFEFGFDVQDSNRLVIWEAQYGDFINNAQTIVDEFLVSARDKWGKLPALVMLLPHGNEGQGPDHSSGRLERFLSLAADNNLRVAYPTTAANYFHLLRRQALLLEVDPLPLVVMTPKSLLRHPLVISPLRELAEGRWQAVIDRLPAPDLAPADAVRRMIVCSGKVYTDLAGSELTKARPETGIVRVEQIAPFPGDELCALLERYPELEEVIWVQEEPKNMGAWLHAQPHLVGMIEKLAAGRKQPLRLRNVSRPRSASPAEGSNNLHAHNQQRLIAEAFGDEWVDEQNGGKPRQARKSGKNGARRAAQPKEE